MSAFEFLSVLISVVVGLGIAHLLRGVGTLLHRHAAMRLCAVHVVWTLFVFFYLVIYWWTVVFGWQDWQNWNIVVFLFVLAYGVLLFLLCVVLYPQDVPEDWDMQAHFTGMRRWFFGIFILMLFAELTDTALKDHFDELSSLYLLVMLPWIALAIVGWFSPSRRVQLAIAVYVLASLLAWAGYQLRDLEWSLRT